MASVFAGMQQLKEEQKRKAEADKANERGPWDMYEADGSEKGKKANPWDMYAEDGTLIGPDPDHIEPGEITETEARLRVGKAPTDKDRLEVLRKFHPDAEPYGDGNFIYTKDGKTRIYNEEGWVPSLNDFASIVPEGAEITGSILGGLFGGTVGAGAGAPTGPGAIATTVGGAVTGAGVGGATAKDLTERGLNWWYGDPDSRTSSEYWKDKTKDVLINAAGEGTGRLLVAGAKPVLRTAQRAWLGGVPDKAAARAVIADAKKAGLKPTLGVVTQSPKAMETEATLLKEFPSGSLARTTRELDEGLASGVKSTKASIFAGETTPNSVGTLLKDATKSAQTKQVAKLNKMYTEVDQLAGSQKVGGKNISEVVKGLEAEKKAMGAAEKLTRGPTINNALKYAKAFEKQAKDGTTFAKAKEFRTDINPLAYGAKEDPYSKQLFQRTYEAVKGDMADAAKGLSDDAFNKWQAADAAYSEYVKKGGVKKVLEGAIKKEEPTKVFDFYSKQIQKAPQSLETVRKTLLDSGGDDAWNAFVSHHVGQLGMKVTEGKGLHFSGGKLVTQLAKMPKESKDALFAGPMKEYGENLERLGRIAAARQTARQVAPAEKDWYGKLINAVLDRGPMKAVRWAASKTVPAYKQSLITSPKIIKEIVDIPKLQMKKAGWAEAKDRLTNAAISETEKKAVRAIIDNIEGNEQ